jgi:hypothetical protein
MSYDNLEEWQELWRLCFLYENWMIAPNYMVYTRATRSLDFLHECREATEYEVTIITHIVKEFGNVEEAFMKHGTKLGRYLNEED